MLQNRIQVDIDYVVPYNKRLSSRFNVHINVEYCGWNVMIKYLFKYISKGADRVGELFYLWLLLSHQKGCQSFVDVRTVSDVLYPSFRATCHALGVTGEDQKWMTAFMEASEWGSPSQLRSLFCQLLLFCDVSDPISLWEASWQVKI